MIKPMVRFAAKSKTAQDELIAFAQANKLNISKFPQLEAALKASHASFAGLESITNSTSDAMSNLSQISQNMSGVMNSQVTSAISSASLKATGFYQAESNLTAAIQKFGANSPQAESAAKAVASSLQHAADMANAVAAGATNATRALDAVPRYIPITMTLTEKVIGSLGGYTGGGVGVNLPGNGGGGHQGPGVVLSGAAAGGNVTIVHQNIAGSVLSDQALARAAQGATLRKTVRNASTQTFLPGRLH